MQNKFLKILKDNSGASLMLVLGVMLLFMAIGVSTLVAASANAGFVLRQKEYNQIMLLGNSVHNNILYSLQKDPSDTGLLSAQLVMAIYEAAGDPAKITKLKDGVKLEMDIDGEGSDWNSGNVKVESIMLSFPEQHVDVRPGIEDITVDVTDDDTETISGEPATATVDATMVVTVKIKANDQSITSRAFYEYTGGVLSEDEASGEMQFAIDESEPITGKWRLIRHENVDTKD